MPTDETDETKAPSLSAKFLIRMSPSLKAEAERRAAEEHRSTAGWIRELIRRDAETNP